jgi:hypothetical protein
MNIFFYNLAWVMFLNMMQKKVNLLLILTWFILKNVTTHKNNMFHKGAHDSVLSVVTHTFLLFCLKIVIELVKMIWQCWISYSREIFLNHDFQIDIKNLWPKKIVVLYNYVKLYLKYFMTYYYHLIQFSCPCLHV